MTRFLPRRAFWNAVVVAAAVGSLTLTPRQATSAWTVGDPIVTYWAGPGYDGGVPLTHAVANQMVDVGMNVVWAATPAEVDVAGQHGLRAIYQNRTWLRPENVGTSGLNTIVDAVRNKPGLYGYHIVDEPSATTFGELSSLVGYLRERDPNHMARINLFPNYANPEWLGSSSNPLSYSEYLDSFVSTVNPSLLSYDHYQFMATSDWGLYLQNLGQVRQKAKSAGIPFMNVVQAASWSSDTRVPTGNEERFLAYTTLAYGAQGIGYYVWNWPGHEGGIVNSDGTPSPIYNTLKATNREFVAIAKQYQSLKSIGAYLKGYSTTTEWSWSQLGWVPVYKGPPGTTTLPSDSPFDISSVSNDMTYSDGDPLEGVLFGFFDKNSTTLTDATFALVVNLDYTVSKTYTVTGPENLSVFNATTGVWMATGHNYAMLDLLPGGGVLVGLTSVVPEPSVIVLLGSFLSCLLARVWWKQKREE